MSRLNISMSSWKPHQDRVPLPQFNPSWMAGDALNPSNLHLDLSQLEFSVWLNCARLLFYDPFISKGEHLKLLSTCLSRMFVSKVLHSSCLLSDVGSSLVMAHASGHCCHGFSLSTSLHNVCVAVIVKCVTCELQNTLLTYIMHSFITLNWQTSPKPISDRVESLFRQQCSHNECGLEGLHSFWVTLFLAFFLPFIDCCTCYIE